MNLLLDTHAFLALCQSPQTLPVPAREATEDPEARIYLSIASAWEIQIKVGIGKLRLAKSVADLVGFELERDVLQLLTVELAHLDELSRLPMIHRDPFDRLLIAQARAERLTLLTADSNIRRYDVQTLWD